MLKTFDTMQQKIALAKVDADLCRRRALQQKIVFNVRKRNRLTSKETLLGAAIVGAVLNLLRRDRVTQKEHIHHQPEIHTAVHEKTIESSKTNSVPVQVLVRIVTGIVTSAIVGGLQHKTVKDKVDQLSRQAQKISEPDSPLKDPANGDLSFH